MKQENLRKKRPLFVPLIVRTLVRKLKPLNKKREGKESANILKTKQKNKGRNIPQLDRQKDNK